MLYDITIKQLEGALYTTHHKTLALAKAISHGYSSLHPLSIDEKLGATLQQTTQHHAVVNALRLKFDLLNLAVQGVKPE